MSPAAGVAAEALAFARRAQRWSLLAGFSSTHGLVLDLTAIELGDRGRRVVSVGPPRGWVSWMSGGPNMGCVTALVISDHVCENSRMARHSDSDR